MQIKTYLGFDVGTKRTGIAVGNSLTKQATGLDTLSHLKDGTPNWQIVDQYITHYKPDTLIVGMPFRADEQMQKMITVVKDFSVKLAQRYQLNVLEVNEYLSSNEAKKQLKYNHEHKNAKRSSIDKRAAQIILQTWLNSH